MQTGLDQLSHDFSRFKNKKIGVLCHAASINRHHQHILDLLWQRVTKHLTLFGPEHGLWGVAQDMESVSEVIDPKTGLIIHSLYGASYDTLSPSIQALRDLDLVICDLQDVGSRYYTFVYSIFFMMQACQKLGIPVYVLDRPNPIGGTVVEGGLINQGFESFVGYFSIANRHGMTAGELAEYFNAEVSLGCQLEVIALQNWNRAAYFDEVKLPWVLPSPNMPTLDTAVVYPGMCLLEATELSEGRGTTRPFEIFGAPFIDPEQWKTRLDEIQLPGVYFRPLYFKPTFQKCAGQICGGLQLHVTDRQAFKPYLAGLAVLYTAHELYPQHFRWREKPYEFVQDIPAIDLLTGSEAFRRSLNEHKGWKNIVENYEIGKEEWMKKRQDFLRY